MINPISKYSPTLGSYVGTQCHMCIAFTLTLEYTLSRYVWVARNPPGFAFVEFEDPRDAQDACRFLDGSRIGSSRIRVEMSRGGGGGGGRGGRARAYSPRRSPRRSPRYSPRRSPVMNRYSRYSRFVWFCGESFCKKAIAYIRFFISLTQMCNSHNHTNNDSLLTKMVKDKLYHRVWVGSTG